MRGWRLALCAAALGVRGSAQDARISPAPVPNPELAAGVLAALCPNDRGPMRCESCPPPVDFGLSLPWTIHAIRRGSFTAAGRDELAVDGTGCAPHSLHWGGTLLLERSGSGWKVMRFEAGLRTNDCVVFRGPGGRDLLVCTEIDGGQGSVGKAVKLVTLDRPRRERVLVAGVDTRLTCGYAIGDPEERLVPVRAFRFVAFAWRPPVLRVVTEEGVRTPTEAERRACVPGAGGLAVPVRRVERVLQVP